MKFSDVIYGDINLPDWMEPFIKIPEFVRLRNVRLSNIDSIDLKDFNTPTRWEHSIGAAYLACEYSKIKKLSEIDSIHLTLAALLHDIGTPPFAHTVEYILSNFDHESESYKLVIGDQVDFSYENSTGQFQKELNRLIIKLNNRKKKKIKLESKKIAEIITGQGEFGYLLNGSIDIDNIDNLIRASFYSGIKIDKEIPYMLIKWLSRFNSAPINISNYEEYGVSEWISYRNELYKKFFESKNDLSRQAFLQHIIRRAYNQGISKKPLIYSTDDTLLISIENFENEQLNSNKNKDLNKSTFLYDGKEYKNTLSSLINKYKLLENVSLIARIPIENEEELRILSNPVFANWLELNLFNESFEPFVLLNKKRFKDNNVLFDNLLGEISVYLLDSSAIWYEVLPTWLKENIDKSCKGEKLLTAFSQVLKNNISIWCKKKPWHNLNEIRISDIISSLEHEKDWSFQSDRNLNIHTYPATFVKTIPGKLISSLNLRGELIIDPFGGTGQTAEEALKLDCRVITSDINSIALLASQAKFQYLKEEVLEELRNLSVDTIININDYKVPSFDNINKWHHKDTIHELAKIKFYILKQKDTVLKTFLLSCFSDILISTTGRKGKGHSYFADNTPLPKNVENPEYCNAIELFKNKVNKNLNVINAFYSNFERKGKETKKELTRVKILKADARELTPEFLGIEKREAAAIITSPPYLCMVDYTLGQRLSYYWLFDEKQFKKDYNLEIGSRRKRNKPLEIYKDYISDIESFIIKSLNLIRTNGYLITILGEPKAIAFKNVNVLDSINSIILSKGFTKIWEKDRKINWHRNHGISSADTERISVYMLEV